MRYPVNHYNQSINKTFFHSNDAKTIDDIMLNGWDPQNRPGIIYGTAVYLSNKRWSKREAYIECRLNLTESEIYDFDTGTEKDVVSFLKNNLGKADMTSRRGNSPQNIKIRNFFLLNKIKAIRFQERGSEVIAVYDPNCIAVIGQGLWRKFKRMKGCSLSKKFKRKRIITSRIYKTDYI